MASGKIEFKFGALSFSGDGEESWLEKQLDKILKALPDLATIKPPEDKEPNPEVKNSGSNGGEKFQGTLASHIREKGAESNQVKRFLATADWMRRRGVDKLTTAGVTKALQENQQKRLSNPAECLNQNVGKGHCEKSADGFFITPDGLKELGYNK